MKDVHAVLAYVRSLKAIESPEPPARKLSFPLNLIVRTIPGPDTYGNEGAEIDFAEDLLQVAVAVSGGELRARAFADAAPVVLAVLQLP